MSDTFTAAIAGADALASEARWEEAAALYARAGVFAFHHEALDAARPAWGRAGEAFRRADRPADAARSLRLALSLPGGDAREVATYQVQLSAVLSETGELDAAEALCARARAEPSVSGIATDGWFSLRMARAPRAELEALLGSLADPWSRALRTAQVERMQGELLAADARLAALESELADHPAGLGGARTERAEIAALRGDGLRAAEAWADARSEHERAGRAGLAWRCEAGRVRCLLDAGVEPVGVALAEGLAWAEGRENRLLAIDLRLVLHRLRRDARGLASVRDEASSLGLVRRAGRAGLARAALLTGPARLVELQDAERALADDEPWAIRAGVARAEALASTAPTACRSLAAPLVARCERVGMEPELARARAILEG